MNIILSLIPIVVLIWMMTKKNAIPSYKALPIAAVIFYLIKLIHFSTDPNLLNAAVLNGLLAAFTPVMIVWGAIFLFKTLEHSGAMDVLRTWLNGISVNKVAQVMIVGWAFSFLIEGASGFGTPAALAAPILFSLGFRPVRVAILCLIMNSVPVSFGAVGTPTWFGFKELRNLKENPLTDQLLMQLGAKTAVVHFAAALIIPIIALIFIFEWKEIKKNIIFIYLSILSCTVPYLILAFFSFEFPSIVAGFIGLLISVFLAHKGIGLEKHDLHQEDELIHKHSFGMVLKSAFPLWGTVLVLVLTRLEFLGIKPLLVSNARLFGLNLGSLGQLEVSKSLVIQLKDIFGNGNIDWTFKLLYVPSIIPFIFISVISFFVFSMKKEKAKAVWCETLDRMKHPLVALLGALVFVKILMVGDTSSAQIIGTALADLTGKSWQFFASYMGALGAFFSGSNTVSNLTFSGIQDSMALKLDLDRTTILALQSVGGAMGNMICIHNIVAVCSVLGLENQEGFILKRTIIPCILYGIVAAIISLIIVMI